MKTNETTPSTDSNRRSFLKNGALWLALGSISGQGAAGQPGELRIGLLTDLHYADKDPKGTRHYRETWTKLEEAAQRWTPNPPDLMVELGDLIDAADSVQTELGYLKTIRKPYAAMAKECHHVLGNHCVDTLRKEEFLGEVGQERSYYSFDRGGVHFVVLDACFRKDGVPYGRRNFQWTDANLPPAELEWLEADLSTNQTPVVVFAHQRLDVATNHGVRNQKQVRAILEKSGRVKAVFQGHSHQNDLQEIGDIHYCTLAAMVEGSGPASNAYSLLTITSDGYLKLEGFRRQASYQWPG